MGKTNFSGPVRSMRGFVTAGPDSVVGITAETTLTFADHAGKVIEINDADGAVTLPTIAANSASAVAGADDLSVNSHIGAVYKFVVGTDCTNSTFAPASSNDVISMNGGTTGGDRGSTVTITAIADNEYLVEAVLIGTGTEATPFADS